MVRKLCGREIFEIGVGDFLESESSSVEIHQCGCQRDCQMGNRLRLPITVSCPVNSYNLMKQ